MLYQPKDLLPYAHGCIGLSRYEERDFFSRFDEKQIAYYSAEHEDFDLRAHSSSGTRIKFVTAQREISFLYRIAAHIVWVQDGIDILENGERVAYYPPNLTKEETKVSYTRKADGPSEIEICLPNGEIFLPYDFDLGEITPVPRKERFILFYGDSVVHSCHTKNPSYGWARMIADEFEAEYLNRGVGAYSFDVGSLPEKPDFSPDLVFIEYGQNDMCHYETTEDGMAAADAYFAKIKSLYPNAKFLFITPDFVGPDGSNEKERQVMPEYCEGYRRLCEKYNIPLLEGSEMMDYDHENYCSDLVHFSEQGIALFAKNLIAEIKERNLI